MFHFASLRRILAEEWNIDKNGPKFNQYTRGLSKDNAIDLNRHLEDEIHQ